MSPERFLAASRRYLGIEYRAKLHAAVAALPADRVWWRPNAESNSAGNLLVHLAGNLQQWIVEGVGGVPFERHRSREFAMRDGADAATLVEALDRVLDDVDRVLAAVDPGRLTEPRRIQGRDLTIFDAIYHVVEHFAYHLGQIVWIAKVHAPGAIQFYEDAGGLARPKW